MIRSIDRERRSKSEPAQEAQPSGSFEMLPVSCLVPGSNPSPHSLVENLPHQSAAALGLPVEQVRASAAAHRVTREYACVPRGVRRWREVTRPLLESAEFLELFVATLPPEHKQGIMNWLAARRAEASEAGEAEG